jgi:hypothetical protein
MKKSFLAGALAAAFSALTFAQTTPPSNPQTPTSQDSGAKKTNEDQEKQEGPQERRRRHHDPVQVIAFRSFAPPPVTLSVSGVTGFFIPR